jgi:hypothetical protein
MNDPRSAYRTYLLTVWKKPARVISDLAQDRPTETGWRFFLEDPRTGQRHGFSNAVDLVATLLAEFGHGPPVSSEAAADEQLP